MATQAEIKELVRAVAYAPRCRTTRLVLADALEESGKDPAVCEWIRGPVYATAIWQMDYGLLGVTFCSDEFQTTHSRCFNLFC